MGKKIIIAMVLSSATMLLTACFGDNSQAIKPNTNPTLSPTLPAQTSRSAVSITQTSQSAVSTTQTSLKYFKCSEDVKKFIIEAQGAVNQIKIKSHGKKISKKGSYEMVDLELEKSKSEIDKYMSNYFAKDLIDFELFRANILYINNKFFSLASNFPSGYIVSATSEFEEVAGGPYETVVQIDTIPNSPENNRLMFTLSKASGKWMITKEDGFDYHKDMYKQIYNKSKKENNKPDEKVNKDEIGQKESFGPLKLGLSKKKVLEILGEPDDQSQSMFQPATGEYLQDLNYKKAGIRVVLSGKSVPDTLGRITLISPCNFKTLKNVGIGSTKEAVVAAYKNEIFSDNKETNEVIVGTPYSGMLFHFENNKVSSMFLGDMAE